MSDLKNKSKEMDPEAAFTMPIHYVIAAVYAVLTVTAFSLNTLVIWAFVKDRTLRTRSNSLILSIAVGDWLHAVLAYPLGVVKNASESWRLSGGACTWYAFITSFLILLFWLFSRRSSLSDWQKYSIDCLLLMVIIHYDYLVLFIIISCRKM